MTVNEHRKICYHSVTSETPLCVNCAHYYPHFSKDGYPLWCGHCATPRLKFRKAYDTCEYFEIKESTK